jgi:hypothetical protein
VSAIIVPPIRAPLTDPRGGTAARSRTAALANAQTTREWYLFFEKLARGLGRLDASVNEGTHEARLATNPANVPDGALWVETDRGNMVYQVQQDEDGEPVWVYLAGTMAGTLTPDERPADLGEFDTGFQFAATDTGRTLQWTGTAWVDITLVRYGTHAARLAIITANIPKGALYVETDRGNVIYQMQGAAWWYLAGIMAGTVSPDQRPADLGANDVDFQFRDTASGDIHTWTGSAWSSPVAPGGTVQIAYCSTPLTLTGAGQDVPGCSLTVSRAGRYLVTACFDFINADPGFNCIGILAGTSNVAIFGSYASATTAVESMVSQQWVMVVPAGHTFQLVVYKTTGTISTSAVTTHTSISATWIAPS